MCVYEWFRHRTNFYQFFMHFRKWFQRYHLYFKFTFFAVNKSEINQFVFSVYFD